MSLADDLAEPPTWRPGPHCGVGLILASLEDDDRTALEHALDPSSRWTARQLVERLERHGIRVDTHAIGRHRRRDCKCPPSPTT